jgi:hypothetical protein
MNKKSAIEIAMKIVKDDEYILRKLGNSCRECGIITCEVKKCPDKVKKRHNI